MKFKEVLPIQQDPELTAPGPRIPQRRFDCGSGPFPFAFVRASQIKGMFTKFWHWQNGFAITRRHLLAAMAKGGI